MLCRANRLGPVALNLPETCEALSDDLTGLISAYREGEPITDVRFLIEADRFYRSLVARADLPGGAREILGANMLQLRSGSPPAGSWDKPSPERRTRTSRERLRTRRVLARLLP
jgi:hypothetical protein